ncbi:MAG: ribbon-helix-helix domain-containing protein [Lactobacillaceae bacterium]|jgi:predicted DNA-binding ribbon-helix-helix protein|nr:ribbon-helix-helix domain-containing protein [Lactobacillaceae bacterium]
MVKLVSRIIYLDCKSTCVRLCDKEWHALDEICKEEKIKRKNLINQIKNHKNKQLGLTPAIRLFTLLYYRKHFQKADLSKLDDNIKTLLTDIS